MRLDKELAEELLWLDSADGYTVIARQYRGRSRWEVKYLLVISDSEGRSWGANYRDPATEIQESDDPYRRYGENDVVFVPVTVSMVPEYGLVS